MAPWPEQGNEPKAPDKNSDKSENVSIDSEVKSKSRNHETASSNSQPSKTDQILWNNCDTGAGSGQFNSLDESQLKALLEEAITYKSPKDRDSKSNLFKELLQEAEADESDCSDETSGTVVGSSSSGNRNLLSNHNKLSSSYKKKHAKRELRTIDRPRGSGSLQNLVHAFRGSNDRHFRDHVTGSVSARQREGGSLPTNVNVQGVDIDDMMHGSEQMYNYTSRATLQVSDDMQNVDAGLSFPLCTKSCLTTLNGSEQPSLQLQSSYNSVKCVMGASTDSKLETVTDADKNGKELNGIDQELTEFKTISTTTQEIPTEEWPYVSVYTPAKCYYTSEFDNWRPASGELIYLNFRDLNQSTANKETNTTSKKSVDENGTALAVNRFDMTDRKGKRRVKSKNYRNIVTAENIEGHRGEDNIDSLLQYIESNSSEGNKSSSKIRQANGSVNLVNKTARLNKIKAKEDEGRKKRNKESKLHKSSSLEEISKTKLEDLTSPNLQSTEDLTRKPPKKQVTLDDTQLSDLRYDDSLIEAENSTGLLDKEELDLYEDNFNEYSKNETSIPKKTDNALDTNQGNGNDFHLVQKKQRKKKRQNVTPSRQGSRKQNGGNRHNGKPFSAHDRMDRDNRGIYRYRHSAGPTENVHLRRKSASSVPPSDNSDEGSDEGSVCSLPVSSTSPCYKLGKTSTSGGSTPQASYADIARSVTSPPRSTRSVTSPPQSIGSVMSPPCSTSSIVSPARSTCSVNNPSARRVTVTSSGAPPSVVSLGTDQETNYLPEPVVIKKDAMTNTSPDTYLPMEQYPPLKVLIGEMENSFKKDKATVTRDISPVKVENPPLPTKTTICTNKNKNTLDDSANKVNVKSDNKVTVSANNTPTTSSNTVNPTNKAPPVTYVTKKRLVEKPGDAAQKYGLTFGFEVNHQLLGDKADNKKDEVPPKPVDKPSFVESSSPPAHISSFPFNEYNYQNTVEMLSSEWNKVMKEYEEERADGVKTKKYRVKYYNPNE